MCETAKPLTPFRHIQLDGPHSPPPVGLEVHDAYHTVLRLGVQHA
jgi:hypothetical protein